ncbi:MAG: ABC transporter ATP-binding protein [Sphingomonas sp.]|uniref:ABC transporter ATP-binding protein n=1 Tax=unclassified Sphingomonas TaxID=196159 RepID=UPI002455C9DA|nr:MULTISPECIES: ABC transporter ATP-binding protein [unclassified Sphingomonas]MBQ1498190.1 ABC transporter ATP-binding protein [Sphingomonas sp.]MDH4742766.1 ABC transporter ATP-binding protein [Sphingomonas sp. CBMAI 2297]
MTAILSIKGVSKTYGSGHKALDHVDLEIRRGEIFALLGPNGAGKTTLISIICGIVTPSTGTILVAGHDAVREPRAARSKIGLVPQEIAVDMFSTVGSALRFSRGLFGKAPDQDFCDQVLKDLSLWDKRDAKIMELSGGMKRRVMIAKALSHQPDILFLDEPTAGVDVSLRRDMWKMIGKLRERGTTIILTTHYIEEAEEMADRVGVINKGQLLLVEDKTALMKKLGKRELDLSLVEPMAAIPAGLEEWHLSLEDEGTRLRYTFDAQAERTGIPSLLRKLGEMGIAFKDLDTSKSSLEDIFVGLVEQRETSNEGAAA